MKSVAVIGGGITGVTTAYALARRGLDVTLFERHRYPAMETSFANGGQLSASHAEAWNSWSTVRKGLAWMLRSDAPLLLNPRPGWHKLSWLAEFLAAIPRYEENTVAIAKLAIAAREHLFGWAREEGIDFDLRQQGILHVYRDKAGFEHAQQVSRLLALAGLQRRAVTPQEMQAIEPALAGQFYGGCFTESDSSGDIHKFTVGLARAAEARGVEFVYGAEVGRLAADGAGVQLAFARDGELPERRFGAVVVCAGTASRAMAAMLGDRVNVYPVKGYSITVMLEDSRSRAAAPTVSLVDDAAKLVASRFGANRFRVAGTAELNGLNRDIRADRIAPLVNWVQQCFPGVGTRQVVPWAGLRPMMPDLLPRVGPGRRPGVFYNTGHGHLGWTLSAATAEIVAGQVQAALAPAAARSSASLAA
jgi:D-amino-acid dehydrogenase